MSEAVKSIVWAPAGQAAVKMMEILATPILAETAAKADEYAAEIRRKAGDLDDFPVYLNEVLVGIYEREKNGSLYVPDKSKDRDQFMAKGGLILKLGPGVDAPNPIVDFCGRKLKVGDWIAFRPADGWPVKIRDQLCRLIPDQLIKLGIPSPDVIY